MIAKTSRRIFDVLAHPHHHRWDFWRSRCNICGRPTMFVCTVPQDRWIRACLACRSTPKYRAIYHVLTRHFGQDPAQRLAQGAHIYELTTTSPICRRLQAHPNYCCSAYMSDRPFGTEIRPRVWNQDLQKLSFGDGSFDIVISSETMEHVRKPWDGFAEIARVLKPGGVHCFTIPYRGEGPTVSRVDTSGPEDVYVLPKVYHQDPYRAVDSLVYTDYGADLPDLLRPLGFETVEHQVLEPAYDIQDDRGPMRVFLSVKR
ncbi:class I SAM-dependent methyltransferase [Paludibaculum fermentans]|uniref:class I SAM-dependent methyltransferase n=1 Tax=Paludibaculum fermentans TaxID=1473598 RepID=UPI003EBF7BF7